MAANQGTPIQTALLFGYPDAAEALARRGARIDDVRVVHSRIGFVAVDDSAVAELSQALVEAGALIRVLSPETVTLEDLFFSLTEGGDGASNGAMVAEPV